LTWTSEATKLRFGGSAEESRYDCNVAGWVDFRACTNVAIAARTPHISREADSQGHFLNAFRDESQCLWPGERLSFGRDDEDETTTNMSHLSSQQISILVVEDDPIMQQMVVSYLEQHDMRAVAASKPQEMSLRFAESDPNLIILDLRLGQEDGFDLLREIRSRSDVPVIITTGHRHDEIDRVVGLELGADDYVTKPFSLRELLARIRAVLRRQESSRVAPQRDPELGRSRFGQLLRHISSLPWRIPRIWEPASMKSSKS
jgi:CheY-like chemotaxis protein